MKGKHLAKATWSRTRIVSVILSVALLFGCITFTTAWLIAEDKDGVPVVNEFTGSKLEITLTSNEEQGSYKLVPGVAYNLEEDIPKITVVANSVECYLFVVYEKVNANYFSDSFSYKNVSKWDSSTIGSNHTLTPSEGNICVYVPQITSSSSLGVVETKDYNQSFEIINRISIPDTVTKTMAHPELFESMGGNEPNPAIRITAYAIQTLGIKDTTASQAEDLKKAWSYVAAAIEADNTKEVVLD